MPEILCNRNRFFRIHISENSRNKAKEVISTADTKLIHALKEGDTAALSAIIDKYTGYVATVIHNQLGAFAAPEDTEELTANVFVALWQNRDRLKTQTIYDLPLAEKMDAVWQLSAGKLYTMDFR